MCDKADLAPRFAVAGSEVSATGTAVANSINRTVILETGNKHIYTFITDLIDKLLAPFDNGRSVRVHRIKKTGVFQLVGIIQSIQVEMIERHRLAFIHHFNRECRTSHIGIYTHTPGNALCKLRLPGSQITR